MEIVFAIKRVNFGGMRNFNFGFTFAIYLGSGQNIMSASRCFHDLIVYFLSLKRFSNNNILLEDILQFLLVQIKVT